MAVTEQPCIKLLWRQIRDYLSISQNFRQTIWNEREKFPFLISGTLNELSERLLRSWAISASFSAVRSNIFVTNLQVVLRRRASWALMQA